MLYKTISEVGGFADDLKIKFQPRLQWHSPRFNTTALNILTFIHTFSHPLSIHPNQRHATMMVPVFNNMQKFDDKQHPAHACILLFLISHTTLDHHWTQ